MRLALTVLTLGALAGLVVSVGGHQSLRTRVDVERFGESPAAAGQTQIAEITKSIDEALSDSPSSQEKGSEEPQEPAVEEEASPSVEEQPVADEPPVEDAVTRAVEEELSPSKDVDRQEALQNLEKADDLLDAAAAAPPADELTEAGMSNMATAMKEGPDGLEAETPAAPEHAAEEHAGAAEEHAASATEELAAPAEDESVAPVIVEDAEQKEMEAAATDETGQGPEVPISEHTAGLEAELTSATSEMDREVEAEISLPEVGAGVNASAVASAPETQEALGDAHETLEKAHQEAQEKVDKATAEAIAERESRVAAAKEQIDKANQEMEAAHKEAEQRIEDAKAHAAEHVAKAKEEADAKVAEAANAVAQEAATNASLAAAGSAAKTDEEIAAEAAAALAMDAAKKASDASHAAEVVKETAVRASKEIEDAKKHHDENVAQATAEAEEIRAKDVDKATEHIHEARKTIEEAREKIVEANDMAKKEIAEAKAKADAEEQEAIAKANQELEAARTAEQHAVQEAEAAAKEQEALAKATEEATKHAEELANEAEHAQTAHEVGEHGGDAEEASEPGVRGANQRARKALKKLHNAVQNADAALEEALKVEEAAVEAVNGTSTDAGAEAEPAATEAEPAVAEAAPEEAGAEAAAEQVVKDEAVAAVEQKAEEAAATEAAAKADEPVVDQPAEAAAAENADSKRDAAAIEQASAEEARFREKRAESPKDSAPVSFSMLEADKAVSRILRNTAQAVQIDTKPMSDREYGIEEEFRFREKGMDKASAREESSRHHHHHHHHQHHQHKQQHLSPKGAHPNAAPLPRFVSARQPNSVLFPYETGSDGSLSGGMQPFTGTQTELSNPINAQIPPYPTLAVLPEVWASTSPSPTPPAVMYNNYNNIPGYPVYRFKAESAHSKAVEDKQAGGASLAQLAATHLRGKSTARRFPMPVDLFGSQVSTQDFATNTNMAMAGNANAVMNNAEPAYDPISPLGEYLAAPSPTGTPQPHFFDGHYDPPMRPWN